MAGLRDYVSGEDLRRRRRMKLAGAGQGVSAQAPAATPRTIDAPAGPQRVPAGGGARRDERQARRQAADAVRQQLTMRGAPDAGPAPGGGTQAPRPGQPPRGGGGGGGQRQFVRRQPGPQLQPGPAQVPQLRPAYQPMMEAKENVGGDFRGAPSYPIDPATRGVPIGAGGVSGVGGPVSAAGGPYPVSIGADGGIVQRPRPMPQAVNYNEPAKPYTEPAFPAGPPVGGDPHPPYVPGPVFDPQQDPASGTYPGYVDPPIQVPVAQHPRPPYVPGPVFDPEPKGGVAYTPGVGGGPGQGPGGGGYGDPRYKRREEEIRMLMLQQGGAF